MNVPRGKALPLDAVATLLAGEGRRDGSPSFTTWRIYHRPWPDGLYVLVDRLWPRGLRREEVDVWAKELAPSTALRRAFGHDKAREETFREAYEQELAAKEPQLRLLCRLAEETQVVLLYAARDDSLTNAHVLKDVLERLGSKE